MLLISAVVLIALPLAWRLRWALDTKESCGAAQQ
jgi:hypothetical protein